MWCLSARGPSQPGPGFAVKWVPWSDVGACVTGSNALEASGSQWVAPGTQAMSGDTRLTGVTGFLAQAGRDQGSCSAPARAQDTQPQASASGETTAAARGQVPPLPGGATACRPPAALAPGVAWRASPSAIHASAPGMGLKLKKNNNNKRREDQERGKKEERKQRRGEKGRKSGNCKKEIRKDSLQGT